MYPTKLKINDLIILNLECKIKKLEERMIELEERIKCIEGSSIVSLSPLPLNTMDDFNLYFQRENATSFDDIQIE